MLCEKTPVNTTLALRKLAKVLTPGHWKTLGTPMGYPIGVLIWAVVESNDQTVFQSILLSQRCQHDLPN